MPRHDGRVRVLRVIGLTLAAAWLLVGCAASVPPSPSPASPPGVTPSSPTPAQLWAGAKDGKVRVLITVSATVDPASATTATTAEAKRQVEQAWGSDVTLLRDYPALPIVLVEVSSLDALERLAILPGVVRLDPDGTLVPG